MNRTVSLLTAAAILMLLAGVVFAVVRQWICAAMLWAGAVGCVAATLSFRSK